MWQWMSAYDSVSTCDCECQHVTACVNMWQVSACDSECQHVTASVNMTECQHLALRVWFSSSECKKDYCTRYIIWKKVTSIVKCWSQTAYYNYCIMIKLWFDEIRQTHTQYTGRRYKSICCSPCSNINCSWCQTSSHMDIAAPVIIVIIHRSDCEVRFQCQDQLVDLFWCGLGLGRGEVVIK